MFKINNSLPLVKLISAEGGTHEYNVTKAGSIHKAIVTEGIKAGDEFSIYLSDGSKENKAKALWVGCNDSAGYATMDVARSIVKSDVFLQQRISQIKSNI